MSNYSQSNVDPLNFEPTVNGSGALDLVVDGTHPLSVGDVVTDTITIQAQATILLKVYDSKDHVMSVVTRGEGTAWSYASNVSTRTFTLPAWNGTDLDFYIDITALDGGGGPVATRGQRVIIRHTSST